MIVFSSLLLASNFLFGELQNPAKMYPNLIGGSGSLHTFSAIPNPDTTFGAELESDFFTDSAFIDSQKQARSRVRLGGNYNLFWHIPWEFFGGFGFSFNENSNPAQSRNSTAYLENFDLGFRLGYPVSGDFWFLGGYGYIRNFSGTQSLRNTSGLSSDQSGPLMTGELGLTSSLHFTHWENWPLRGDINVGYRLPNGNLAANNDLAKFSFDSFKYHALIYSISAELLYHYAKPFVGFSGEYALFASEPVSFGDNRDAFTVGVRVTPVQALSFLGALDIGIGGPSSQKSIGIPRNPTYNIYLGLQLQTLGKTINSSESSLRGVITDQETGKPLASVRVTLIGERSVPLTTDVSGLYSFPHLGKGNFQIRFELEGYETVTRSLTIREGEHNVVDASLGATRPKTADLDIAIIDSATQAPIEKAVVSVSGFDSRLSTDSRGQVRVPAAMEGIHQVRVEAIGYESRDFVAEVRAGQPNTQTYTLDKALPQTGACAGTVKNKEGTGLTAVFTPVSAENTATPSFATNPLTGAFEQTLPPGAYEYKVQAENYLPQTITCDVKVGDKTNLGIVLEKPQQATLIENKIVLPDAIYFDFGSERIQGKSFKVLDQVAKILMSPRVAYDQLRVEGHTDDVGSAEYNLKLSQRRAQSVRRYLIKKGVVARKVIAKGFGKSKPVATNLVEDGRAENRRVEFNLVRKKK